MDKLSTPVCKGCPDPYFCFYEGYCIHDEEGSADQNMTERRSKQNTTEQQQKNSIMNLDQSKILGRLSEIERKQIELSRQMQYERKVYQAELEERLRLGLQGDDAYKHYCDYMAAHGLKP